jgi:hypothetical protein
MKEQLSESEQPTESGQYKGTFWIGSDGLGFKTFLSFESDGQETFLSLKPFCPSDPRNLSVFETFLSLGSDGQDQENL